MNCNTNLKVKNLKGTSKPRYVQVNRLAAWRKYCKSERKSCAVVNCNNECKVGAHVKLTDGRRGNQWYIAPFCFGCNHWTNGQEMFLKKGVGLMPVVEKEDGKMVK
mmetsp:Transcript_23324/g.56556  ORF Transcript_23324/g.56556 Transcript_23324/m.56556 type:complete len:106 (-) Transcript_23324:287-604(-)|eukprot:CAMPEP_0114494092 /NCGR_PEP_ID=MMETSP0109-20121206/4464_1 /TAXON_ID=29199 /ORGANISM="Chlorarachnion reptans, Strain CCCM449" /LENGTH=105 /DNA_ID=CAMNT_0001671099 /DNA_START=181 /DNA_END=498 /DNA_ORIENTATION=+